MSNSLLGSGFSTFPCVDVGGGTCKVEVGRVVVAETVGVDVFMAGIDEVTGVGNKKQFPAADISD